MVDILCEQSYFPEIYFPKLPVFLSKDSSAIIDIEQGDSRSHTLAEKEIEFDCNSSCLGHFHKPTRGRRIEGLAKDFVAGKYKFPGSPSGRLNQRCGSKFDVPM